MRLSCINFANNMAMRERKEKYNMLSVVGPTACGKTSLAVDLALALDGAEIISADSRQVYKGMDIGTGKDIEEYTRCGVSVPVHLIDIVDAGEKYNLFEFQRDFLASYEGIVARGGFPIMCGGSGMYVESVLKGYRLLPVPENPKLREELEKKSLEELTVMLAQYKELHNNTDTDSKKRAIRAIEIEEYYLNCPVEERSFPCLNSLTIGVSVDREIRRGRISRRLKDRLADGMVDEVKNLLDSGLQPEQLIYYGLEYKYITLYLVGAMDYDSMVQGLEIAIHQFAKRQMTWFRGMEKRGVEIKWVDAMLPREEQVGLIKSMLYD
jgi:tRNA dimethylallyltransferase